MTVILPTFTDDEGRWPPPEAYEATVTAFAEQISTEARGQTSAPSGVAIKDRTTTLAARMVRGPQIEPQLTSDYIVKGWLSADTFGVTFGAPGSGKSFFVLDMLRHVVQGAEWRGNRVRKCSVLYVAGEGQRGTLNRASAAGGMPDNFIFLPALIDLCSNETDARAVIEAFRAIAPDAGDPGVVVFDTLARAMGGGDENSGQDMGRLIRHADIIRELTGAHVHLVHHSGKDAERGARGWSGLLGAVDTEIRVEKRDDGTRVATLTKQKDGETGIQAAYRLVPVDLGLDQDGDPVTTCRVEHCDEAPALQRREMSTSLRRSLETFLAAKQRAGGGEDLGASITAEQWRPIFYEKSTADGPEAKKKAFQRARTDLVHAGHLTVVNDQYQLARIPEWLR